MELSRRNFLKRQLGFTSLLGFGAHVPLFLARTADAAETFLPESESVLVVLQLSGGNDGLNTVVPFEDDLYHRSRPTLRLPPERVLRLGSGLGLHPQMGAFHRLYQEGHLSVVQGVGYPKSSRDHDQAMFDWHAAAVNPRPADLTRTGWLGRAVDQAADLSRRKSPGVFVGEIQSPFALQTERALVPAIHSLDDWLPAGVDAEPTPPLEAGADSLFMVVREQCAAAHAAARRLSAVRAALPSAKPRSYPAFPLAQTLALIAQLIRADLGIRIYFAELGGGGIGGFDTHANQRDNHGALLRQLSESVAAFVEDLKQDRLLDSVLLMTFSEFGRTVSENGRRGTDHGVAAPVFLAGGRVRGGLIGKHPSLSDLDADALKFHTDFRCMYSAVLDGWLGLDSRTILGGKFDAVPGLFA
jgi:uncharacterized protein (DUF1501 family)